MKQARFRFYAALGDFLPLARRGIEFSHRFRGRPAVKDAIEALGVPHPEVELILLNGDACGFSRRLDDGDRVSAFPAFASLDPGLPGLLRPAVPGVPRFVLDVHLGRLARHLRMLGFDAAFRVDADDAGLARIAGSEGRILLTRDRALLKRGEVIWGTAVRSDHLADQLRQVAGRWSLAATAAPFTRCPRCNAPLAEAAPEEVRDRVPARVFQRQDSFRLCPGCGRIYWPGTHLERVRALFARVLPDGPSGAGPP